MLGQAQSVAVLPLSAQGVDSTSAQLLTEALSEEILNLGRLRVMNRSLMTKVLKDQGFVSCDQAECARSMGDVLGVEKIVVGSVARQDTEYSLKLIGVNVKTGAIEVASVRNSLKGDIEWVWSSQIPSLAQELSVGLTGNGEGPSLAAVEPGDTSIQTDSIPNATASRRNSQDLVRAGKLRYSEVHEGNRGVVGLTMGLTSYASPILGVRLGYEYSGVGLTLGSSLLGGYEVRAFKHFVENAVALQYSKSGRYDNNFTEVAAEFQADIGDPGEFYLEFGAGVLMRDRTTKSGASPVGHFGFMYRYF
ncbi:MAG: hypothetical protein RL318_1656 [Fibrobacterota bacterium]